MSKWTENCSYHQLSGMSRRPDFCPRLVIHALSFWVYRRIKMTIQQSSFPHTCCLPHWLPVLGIFSSVVDALHNSILYGTAADYLYKMKCAQNSLSLTHVVFLHCHKFLLCASLESVSTSYSELLCSLTRHSQQPTASTCFSLISGSVLSTLPVNICIFKKELWSLTVWSDASLIIQHFPFMNVISVISNLAY